MIYLIGGPPRTGKSTLAKLLSEKLSIPYLATDDIQKVIRAYIPQNEHAEKLPFYTMEQQAEYKNDALFAAHSTDEIVQAYTQQSETYWPGFRDLIAYFLKDHRNYIIEGHILHPAFVHEFGSEELNVAYLYKESERVIRDDLLKNHAEHDWALERTESVETFEKMATVIAQYGLYLKTEAEKYNFAIFGLDHNFAKKMHEVVAFLEASLPVIN